MSQSAFDPHPEEESKFKRKFKENPFFPIAIGGFLGVVAYGLYGLKNRKMPLSLYIIQFRVLSQGLAVGTLSVGMAWMLGQKLYKKFDTRNEIEGSSTEPASSSST